MSGGGRVLVACVGNVLRHDDGFGVAVAERISAEGGLPGEVDLIETGIGGMSIVQQLMDGYQGLVIVDAVNRGAEPGTLFEFEPQVPDAGSMPTDEWRAVFSNLHLAEPYRVCLLAKSIGVLPRQVRLLGCQPLDVDEMTDTLSPPVAAAVPTAALRVRALAHSMLAGGVA